MHISGFVRVAYGVGYWVVRNDAHADARARGVASPGPTRGDGMLESMSPAIHG